MKRGQVFVRAKNKEGKWDSVDVLDLDEVSFRAFVIDKMVQIGILVAMKEEVCEGDPIEYQEVEDATKNNEV